MPAQSSTAGGEAGEGIATSDGHSNNGDGISGDLDCHPTDEFLGKWQHLRDYIPKNVHPWDIVKKLKVVETPEEYADDGAIDPECLIDNLLSETHSPAGSKQNVVIINNLIVIIQAYLFFSQFIEMERPRGKYMVQIIYTPALDLIKEELNLFSTHHPVTMTPATCILDLIDLYATHHDKWMSKLRDEYTTELGAQVVLEHDPKTNLLGDLLKDWFNLRVTQKHQSRPIPDLKTSDSIYEKLLASRILQWREIMPSNKHLLFETRLAVPRVYERRVLDDDPAVSLGRLLSKNDIDRRMAQEGVIFPLGRHLNTRDPKDNADGHKFVDLLDVPIDEWKQWKEGIAILYRASRLYGEMMVSMRKAGKQGKAAAQHSSNAEVEAKIQELKTAMKAELKVKFDELFERTKKWDECYVEPEGDQGASSADLEVKVQEMRTEFNTKLDAILEQNKKFEGHEEGAAAQEPTNADLKVQIVNLKAEFKSMLDGRDKELHAKLDAVLGVKRKREEYEEAEEETE